MGYQLQMFFKYYNVILVVLGSYLRSGQDNPHSLVTSSNHLAAAQVWKNSVRILI